MALPVLFCTLALLVAGGCIGEETATETGATAGARQDGEWPGVVTALQPSVVTILTSSGSGSGVVYRDGGVIVTNEHVVRGARKVQVALADGSRIGGKVAAADRSTDLAVVRADRTDLPPATFQSALPQVGEDVVAIGSPLGFEGSVTAGIISGLARQIPGSARETRSLVDLIQTDAAISPGNSGGALANAKGEIIGINEAYLPPATGAVSIGFAIPARTVVDTVDELLTTGRADHAYLGVVPGRLTPQIAEAFGVGVERGIVVTEATRGGPAAKAGIARGDVITRISDRRITSVEDLLGALQSHDPGDTVPVTLHRGGRTITANVKLGDLPS
ncbi:signal protein PDZ [Actinomadura craniellae]|uniref:Signal protein PDZ n=1 Tax=Actinomadura craniellae TaxID=2231787 RepID=A0A365H0F2_9ACTN|nr:signal protein PDZ [Actinomadura craniellae]